MLIAKLEDQTGTIELVVFPKWYPQLSPSFTDDAIVVVKARVKERRQGPQGRPVVVAADAGESVDEERPEISLQVVEVWPLASAPVLTTRPAPVFTARPVPASVPATAPNASLAPSASVAAPNPALAPPDATLNVRLCGDAEDAHRLGRLRDLVSSAGGGSGKIVLHAGANGDTRPLKQSVAITDAMRAELAGLFGGDNVWQADER
jgi:hypothetical protein